jgi:hypothetical protein
MTSTTLRRIATLSAGAALALSGLTGLASSPASADQSPSGTSATSWLTGELTNGLFHFVVTDPPPGFEYDDYGLSIDGGFAELSAGNTAVAAQVRDAVATHISDYITGEAFGDPGSTYAGPTAKALVYAQSTGGTPTSFGGVNLVSRLESTVATGGRLADVSTFGDNANTIGQSFAARGLTTAGSAKAADVTSFLLKQQCPAGFFRLHFNGDAACAANTDPDTDVTAFAMLNLQNQSQKPEVASALARAATWLTTTQAADGSFGGGGVTAAPNTNSTGLAAWALGASCRVAAADKAAAYVRGFQVPAGQTGPLSTEVGAIAYDGAARTLGQSEGITNATSDQWRRATAQAAPGLAWDPSSAATVQVSGPKGFIKAGDTAKVTITGASAGERVCVTDSAGGVAALTGTGSALTYELDVAKKSKDVTVSATTGPGSASDEVQVLGKQRLKPKLAKTVHRGQRATVTVKKLGAKEKVKVYVDGKVVDKGKATKKGVFKGHLPKGLKVGTHKLKVVGQFKNRVGTATFRVVG